MNSLIYIRITLFVLAFFNFRAFAEEKVAIVLNLGPGVLGNVESKYLQIGMELGIQHVQKIAEKNKIGFEFLNDYGDVEKVISLGRELSSRKDVSLVISGYTSKTAVPLARTLTNKLYLATFASSKESVVNPQLHARLISDNDEQGRLMFAFGWSRFVPRTMCVISEADDGFSLAVKRGILNKARQTGALRNVATFSYLGDRSSEIRSTLEECYKEKPELIFHSGRSSSARVFLNSHLKNSPHIPVIASDGWGDLSLLLYGENKHLLQETGARIYVAYYWNEVPNSRVQKEFASRLIERGEEPCSLSALGFDAIIAATSLLSQRKRTFQELEEAFAQIQPVAPLLLMGSGNHFKLPVKQRVFRLSPQKALVIEP